MASARRRERMTGKERPPALSAPRAQRRRAHIGLKSAPAKSRAMLSGSRRLVGGLSGEQLFDLVGRAERAVAGAEQSGGAARFRAVIGISQDVLGGRPDGGRIRFLAKD